MANDVLPAPTTIITPSTTATATATTTNTKISSSLISANDLEIENDVSSSPPRKTSYKEEEEQMQKYGPEHDNITNNIPPQILNLSFNQDGGCLSIGLSTGFVICNVYPFQEAFHRNTSGTGGINKVEMLFRCNLLALVGGGGQPKYPRNKVMLWDDHRGRTIGELSFRQNVLNVKLRRDRIVVVLYDRIYLYNFSDLTLLDQIPTIANPNGLVCLSPDNNTDHTAGGGVLACPSIHRGGVRVELYGWRKTQLIDAHENPLASLGLSVDGSLLATASERGTLVRIFSTKDSSLIYEFRRGVERASISCISFSLCKSWLGVCSDRGTVHIFQLKQHQHPQMQQHDHTSTKIVSSVWSKVKPWVSTSDPNGPAIENSYAQVRGIKNPYICAFVPDRPTTLSVVDKENACMLLADFGKGPGEAERVSYHVLLKGHDLIPTASSEPKPSQTPEVNYEDSEIIFGDDEIEEGFVNVERQELHENLNNDKAVTGI